MAAFKVEIRDHFRGIFFSSSFLHAALNLNKLNVLARLNHFKKNKLNSYFNGSILAFLLALPWRYLGSVQKLLHLTF